MVRYVTLLLVLLLVTVAPGSAAGQASPLVPTDDPAYRDLDALVARGWVDGLILTQRPYSRFTFARSVVAARAAMAAERENGASGPGTRLLEALDRLDSRFSPEVDVLAAPTDSSTLDPYLRLRRASTDATLADSPSRSVEDGYGFWPEDPHSYIDAEVNPLLQRNLGRRLADGWTLGGEALVDVGLGRYVAGQLRPRASVLDGAGGDADAQAALMAGYVRGVWGKVALDVGRNHVTHGFSRELAPILSNNPRALPMIRLYNERPGRLPWILRWLGPASFGLTVAGMGEEQDTPGSAISLVEASIRPHPNLELGGVLLTHQGGENTPEVGWWDRVRDALPFILHRRFFGSLDSGASDKVLGMEAHLRVPGPGLEFSVEFATTDDHSLFVGREEALWQEAVWTVGGRATGLGAASRYDVWVEGTHSGIRPYTHHQFTSGLTVDDRIIGSPLGPLAAGVQGGVRWNGTANTFAGTVAYERYADDFYVEVGFDNMDSDTWEWARFEDDPDELRLRATVDWLRRPAPTGIGTRVLLGWERVTRFAFTEESRSNLLGQVSLEYRW